ncbi:Uncharacterised protein [Klebsiella pneumoniae subsp. pneumoniae]|nr:Uncharacterised protein [Klebsiella pneumoniae subsp. pneumoniae]
MAATPYPAYGALYIKRLRNTVGPRKRSAAGQAVPDSVPVVVPDGGYALSGLRSPVYQTVTQHRRPAQAQRRRASCTRLRSRHCAGWRLTPYPAYGALYIKQLLNTVGPRKRSAAGQAVPDPVPVVVPDGGYALSGLRSPVYQTVTHTVGPRKRSAAGQAVPDSVPVVVPDGG